LTGLIWLADRLFWAPGRRLEQQRLLARGVDSANAGMALKEPLIVEYARAFFPVIFAVLILRSFVFEPFRIPSNSMMPTLLTGDFILVNKFTYGIRLPVVDKKIIDVNTPQRGDVIVFRYPVNPAQDYIKRVVGVPGDHILYEDKILYINGEEVEQQPQGIYTGVGAGSGLTGSALQLEQLGTAEHNILLRTGDASVGKYEVTVPPEAYFVMGDNRDNSADSRVWGFVPEKNLVGKAFRIWMNWDLTNADGAITWSRIGSRVE
jgi:signal peptidase I